MKYLAMLMVLVMFSSAPLAQTIEVTSLKQHSFLQETDMVFWQTMPFAVFWAHFIDRQMANYYYPGTEANWTAIVSWAGLISLANALVSARKVVNHERAGQGQ